MAKKEEKKATANGNIKFIDPQKDVYGLDDIVELIEFNFGYSPYPGKTKDKSTKEYKRIRKKISRGLQGKKLNISTARNPLYSKVAVYHFLNNDAYKYFVKASNSKEEYERKIEDAKAEFFERMNRISKLDDLEVRLEQKKQEVLFKIVVDYVSRYCISIDEKLIEADINTCEDLYGRQLDDLTPNQLLIYNRVHGNVREYYTLPEKK